MTHLKWCKSKRVQTDSDVPSESFTPRKEFAEEEQGHVSLGMDIPAIHALLLPIRTVSNDV